VSFVLKKLTDAIVIGVGYMLSPLSWWNDLFFNLPLAYGFAYVVTWGHPDWFWAATIMGYWLSNVLGIVMMQWGAVDLFFSQGQRNWRRDLLISLGSSTAYTLVVAALVYTHLLQVPEFLAQAPN